MSPDYNDENDEIKPVPYANLEDPQGLNQYAYAGNNPLTYIDTDGHACQTTTFTQVFNGEVVSRSTVRTCSAGLSPLETNLWEAVTKTYNPLSMLSNFVDRHPSVQQGMKWLGPKCKPGQECIANAEIPWGMVGGLGGASGLLSGAEQNALKGVLKGIESGAEKGRPFFNQARAAYGGVSPLPAQGAGYYTRFTVSLGAGGPHLEH